ncbi:hypothetical protein AB0D04_28990 [Streptomyces sp. NPDC048483]|uniref:hypothetical protein n=1 Tax=Streptomyces sp. NPDC048483 TaxID=3154927 RepID=UPI003438FB28
MALVAGVQGVANAATPSTASAGSVPSCVVGHELAMGTVAVDIINKCSTSQRVTVKYKNGVVDEKCYAVKPGETKRTWVPVNISHFDRLISC